MDERKATDHPAVRGSLLWLGSIATLIIVGVIGYAVYLVRQYIPIVGYIWLASLAIIPTLGVIFLVIFLIKYTLKEEYYDIAMYGTRVKAIFSNPSLLPPMGTTTATNAARIAKSKTNIQTAIPTLADLLALGEIYYGMTDMILGYLEAGQVNRGPWPRTFAVAGKGRSGKTRRVVFMVIQALMGGAHITICDPHHTKHDSLTKELDPLALWIHFAGSDKEIISASEEFLDEMESRVRTNSEEMPQPRLIIYDEWSRLMTRIEQEDTEKLIEVVTATSQEYAGYGGYACVIGQSWIAEECGGTKIRRALHAVFVHRIDVDYAKFLIKPAKWYKQTEQLETGHCLYQDLDGKIQKLIMPYVEDGAAVKVAELLRQVAPPAETERIAEHASASTSNQPVERENVIYLTEVAREARREVDSEARVTDETFVSVLREIGKKLRAGETPNDIRKSLGITGGRAMQEVNSALDFLQEHTEMEGTND